MRLRFTTMALSAALLGATTLAAVPADAQRYGYGHHDGHRGYHDGYRHDHRGYRGGYGAYHDRYRHHHGRRDDHRHGYYGRHW